MVKSTSILALLSSVLFACSQTRAQGYADTSLAAVTAALAYVRPAPAVPASTETSSLATTRASGSQPPVYGQDGALPAECCMDPINRPDMLHCICNACTCEATCSTFLNCTPLQLCLPRASSLESGYLLSFLCQTPLRKCQLHSATSCERAYKNAEYAADRKPCGFSQTFNMTGQWSKSPSPSFHGFYNMTADCPPYAQDFDCQTPQKSGMLMLATTPLDFPGGQSHLLSQHGLCSGA